MALRSRDATAQSRRKSWSWIELGILWLSVALAFIATAKPAHATFPGANGRIAFSVTPALGGNSDIWTMSADGTGRTNITASKAVDFAPDWSPDGSRIVFVSTQDDPSQEIYVMDADGSNVQRLTNSTALESQPAWSPDGTEILFRSTRTGNSELFVMNVDGTNVRQLTNDPAIDWFPAWSPDGETIAFASTRSGAQAIYLMPSDGGQAQKITSDALEANDPDFSPDGSSLVFINNFCGACAESDVFTLQLATGTIVQRTSGIGNNLTPCWSPDGAKILFMNMKLAHTANGPAELFVMNPDGASLANLSNTPGFREVAPRWGTNTS